MEPNLKSVIEKIMDGLKKSSDSTFRNYKLIKEQQGLIKTLIEAIKLQGDRMDLLEQRINLSEDAEKITKLLDQ